jgi:5-methylcytosine-specific restriction endonuclease McrA
MSKKSFTFEKFEHPALDDINQTLDDIAALETMLAEAKEQLYRNVADLPAKIGDNEDLRDAVFHHFYWFDERVPGTALKQTFDRWPASQTRKAKSHTAIRPAQVKIICEQCEQPFLGEISSRNQLSVYRAIGYVWDQKKCKSCKEKETLRSEEDHRQRELQRQQHLDYLHTMPYREYLQTAEWDETRKRAMKRAGFRCQVCNVYGVRLNVHHRTYERRGFEENQDLITLCERCHEIFHTNGKLARTEVEE